MAAACIQRSRFFDCPPQARPYTGCELEERCPLLRMPHEVAPRRLTGLLRVARATALAEVPLGLIAPDTAWLHVVQRQCLGRKRTATINTAAAVPIEDACPRARSRLCHESFYTDNAGMLP